MPRNVVLRRWQDKKLIPCFSHLVRIDDKNLVVTTSAVFVVLSLKTQGRDKNPTTCSWHSAYALYRLFWLTGPELGTRQATTRKRNLSWYSYPAPRHKQVPVLCFNFFFPRVRAVFSLHIIFYRQLHFPSQPGVAKESWENEAESCLAVAYVFGCFLHEIKEISHFQGSEAGQLVA